MRFVKFFLIKNIFLVIDFDFLHMLNVLIDVIIYAGSFLE